MSNNTIDNKIHQLDKKLDELKMQDLLRELKNISLCLDAIKNSIDNVNRHLEYLDLLI